MSDYDEINKLLIPLADLRVLIVQLMKDGYTEIALGDFLLLVQEVYRKGK